MMFRALRFFFHFHGSDSRAVFSLQPGYSFHEPVRIPARNKLCPSCSHADRSQPNLVLLRLQTHFFLSDQIADSAKMLYSAEAVHNLRSAEAVHNRRSAEAAHSCRSAEAAHSRHTAEAAHSRHTVEAVRVLPLEDRSGL